ncbi:MAG: lipopolysaccharide biosynthesis protein [Pseudolabrys sp.]|nr:lipopolysaccharide biosynthesis protein [Pseudolabrys sp.]
MSAATVVYAPDEGPDMAALGRRLWQRKGRILATTLIFGAVAFVVVTLMTPQYRSEARLLLEARENVFLRADAEKNADLSTLDAEAVASQTQVVLSRDLAREVIAKEKLAQKREFNPTSSVLRTVLGLLGMTRDPGSLTRDERVLESYYERLNVYAIDKSRVIAIDFTSADPQLAADVANAIAETYLQMQQAAKRDQTRAASAWLAGEIDKMRAKVAEAEAKVEAYRTQSNLYAGSNNTLLPTQQLTEINSQIAAARGQQADLEARATRLRALIKSGQPIDSSDIANSELMRRLAEQRMIIQAQLAEQSTTLLDQHPRIKELKAQLAEIDQLMRREAERLARQLDNDAKVAGERIRTLTASLDQVKKAASQTNERDLELRALEREAKTQRDLLESYLAKYREATARESINAAPPAARIISRATPAIKPAYPKKLPTVLVAAFAGFALSAGFVVTGALLASPSAAARGLTGAAPMELGTAAAVMPLAASPPLAPPATSAAMAAAVPPAAQREQEIASLARELRAAGEGGRRIAVLGAERNVGTTFAAHALARALAESASAVLVDLAFATPRIGALSVEPEAPGIADLVRGRASFGDIVTRDASSRLHLVGAGRLDGMEAAAVAASPMIATVVEALARSYQHVVLDLGAVPDCALERFAALAPRALLVTADPAAAATRATRAAILGAGFAEVRILLGGARAAAA